MSTTTMPGGAVMMAEPLEGESGVQWLLAVLAVPLVVGWSAALFYLGMLASAAALASLDGAMTSTAVGLILGAAAAITIPYTAVWVWKGALGSKHLGWTAAETLAVVTLAIPFVGWIMYAVRRPCTPDADRYLLHPEKRPYWENVGNMLVMGLAYGFMTPILAALLIQLFPMTLPGAAGIIFALTILGILAGMLIRLPQGVHRETLVLGADSAMLERSKDGATMELVGARIGEPVDARMAKHGAFTVYGTRRDGTPAELTLTPARFASAAEYERLRADLNG